MTKKVIGLEEFKNLDLKEQLSLLHKDGVHVGKRTVDGNILILYQLHDFYIEVNYKEYRKEVDKIVISKEVDIVQPYLNQVGVKDLDTNKE